MTTEFESIVVRPIDFDSPMDRAGLRAIDDECEIPAHDRLSLRSESCLRSKFVAVAEWRGQIAGYVVPRLGPVEGDIHIEYFAVRKIFQRDHVVEDSLLHMIGLLAGQSGFKHIVAALSCHCDDCPGPTRLRGRGWKFFKVQKHKNYPPNHLFRISADDLVAISQEDVYAVTRED